MTKRKDEDDEIELTDESDGIVDRMASAFERVIERLEAKQRTSAETTAEAVAQVTERMFDARAAGERLYEEKSTLNPLGEKHHPRPDIRGEIFWCGTKVQKEECTREEIDLLNQLKPFDGMLTAPSGRLFRFTVTNLETPGSPNRRLLVMFPCKDPNDRMDLPGLVNMCQQALGIAPGAAA